MEPHNIKGLEDALGSRLTPSFQDGKAETQRGDQLPGAYSRGAWLELWAPDPCLTSHARVSAL